MNDHDENDETSELASDQWWLATVGNLLVWARLRVRNSGIAEILDCDGRIDTHDSEETARAALMDAEYHAFDGLDDDDAAQMGFDLDEIEPPQIGDQDEEVIRGVMTRRLPSTH